MKRWIALLLAVSLLLLAGCRRDEAKKPESEGSAQTREAAGESAPNTEAAPVTEPAPAPQGSTEPEPPEQDPEDLFRGRNYYSATWSCFHSVAVECFDELGKGFNDFVIHNIDLRTGEELDAMELLKRLGVENPFRFLAAAKEAALAQFDRLFPLEGSGESAFPTEFDRAWTEDEVEFSGVFLTEDGRLAAAVKIGGPSFPERGYQYHIVYPELAITAPDPDATPERTWYPSEIPNVESEIQAVLRYANQEEYQLEQYCQASHFRDFYSLVVRDSTGAEPGGNDVYRVYCYNKADRSFCDTVRLLEAMSVSQRSFLEGARQAVLDYFDRYYADYDGEARETLCLEAARTWTARQISLATPAYPDSSGSLHIIARIAKPEGRGWFFADLRPSIGMG